MRKWVCFVIGNILVVNTWKHWCHISHIITLTLTHFKMTPSYFLFNFNVVVQKANCPGFFGPLMPLWACFSHFSFITEYHWMVFVLKQTNKSIMLSFTLTALDEHQSSVCLNESEWYHVPTSYPQRTHHDCLIKPVLWLKDNLLHNR